MVASETETLHLEDSEDESLEGERLPRESRLRQRREYLLVQRTGRRVHTPHYVVIVLPSTAAHARRRIGVTVTKKVANAVGRNRVKRVVREIFRRNQRMFPPSCDVVVIAKQGAPALGYGEAYRELARVEKALTRAATKARRARPAPQAP